MPARLFPEDLSARTLDRPFAQTGLQETVWASLYHKKAKNGRGLRKIRKIFFMPEAAAGENKRFFGALI
ncbi:MAG: hypothetical protein FWD39_00610 [Clostridiales bacterium]|nr:hypothetical protein [Clostridiales bacterium]